MKRAVLAFASTLAVAGCALIIDLGDEPKLAATDAGTTNDAPSGPVDSGNDETSTPVDAGTDSNPPPVYECGLPPSTNAECAACIKGNGSPNSGCCDVSKACAADPRCVQGLDCVKHCLVQSGCVNKCLSDYPEVQSEALCSATQCSKCTPGPECAKLGKCVFDLPDGLVRTVQEGRILDLDESVCHKARVDLTNDGTVDASVCFDP